MSDVAEKDEAEEVEEKQEREPRVISRFTIADLPRYGPWLVSRLMERWPMYSEAYYVGQIKAWTNDNSVHFIRCGDAVGLFYIQKERVDPRPIVREEFCWKENYDKNDREILALYTHAKNWAKSIRAKSFWAGGRADLGAKTVQTYIKGTLSNECFVDLTK